MAKKAITDNKTNMATKTITDNKTNMPTETITDNETDVETMTQEIEILSDNQDSPSSTLSTDRNADSQRSMSEESTIEDDPSQRRSTRLSHKDLPNRMYVPMKRADYGVQERKKPLPSYRRNNDRVITKRMLEMERIRLEKERALLARERRLLEKERQQNSAPSNQSAEQTRLDSWLKTEPNQQFQLISVPETTSTSTTIANIFQPGSGMGYTVASSESGGAVPTVRDYLKNQLNIQRGKTTHLPPLRVFKQRKPSVLPIPQPTTMLYNEQNPNPQAFLQRLITANQYQHQAVPNTLRFMRVPQMAGGATLASFNQLDSQVDSFRKLLNSTVEDIERPHENRQRIRTFTYQNFGRRNSTEDEDDTRQSNNRIAIQSAKTEETEEDDIEVVFEKNKPAETKQESNFNNNSVDSTNYAFSSDINNLHPLNFKYLLKQAEAQTATQKKKRAATTTIKPEISNVVPLDLNSLLGDGNSTQEAIYSEVIELDDDSPVESKKPKNEVTTEITEVRPLDLNSLLAKTNSNGSEGSPSTSTNSDNSEVAILEESDVIDEAHKLFQGSSKPMKVRGAPRARSKKWKTMNPEEEREAIMKILRQL